MYEVKIGDRTNPEPNTLRYFEKQFHLTSTSGGRCKVGVIFDADRMNEESQNALLKTLEEPPPETLLILGDRESGRAAADHPVALPAAAAADQPLRIFVPRSRGIDRGAESPGDEGARRPRARRRAGRRDLPVAAGLNSDATGVPPRSGRGGSMRRPRPATPRSSSASRRRRSTPGYGAYMKERGLFLSAIHSFASELYLLSSGIPFGELPNPELFPDGAAVGVPPDLGELVLKEADELLFTLRFNVNEELALRSFAVNAAMK